MQGKIVPKHQSFWEGRKPWSCRYKLLLDPFHKKRGQLIKQPASTSDHCVWRLCWPTMMNMIEPVSTVQQTSLQGKHWQHTNSDNRFSRFSLFHSEMVAARKKPSAPAPPASRTSSTQALPRTTSVKSHSKISDNSPLSSLQAVHVLFVAYAVRSSSWL